MTVVAELAVSNICWPHGADAQEQAIETLAAEGVYAIDIAPGKAFPEIAQHGAQSVDRDDLVAFRRTLRFRDRASDYAGVMRIAGFQGVTFGRPESIFSEDPAESEALAKHMRGIINLAEFVGAQTIVYGSGGTRLTGDLSQAQIFERAADFFVPLSAEARNAGVVLGIEPLSTTWTKGQPVFGRTGDEVVTFISKLDEEHGVGNVAFVPDSFAMHDGGDNIQDTVRTAQQLGILAPHAQIAEPGMAPHDFRGPIEDAHDQLDIALMSNMIEQSRDRAAVGAPMPTLAIEMFPPKAEDGSVLIGSDLQFVLSGVIQAAKYNYSRTVGRYR